MGAEFLHIGIPVATREPHMVYSIGVKLWGSDPDSYDCEMEYFELEEEGPFPEIMHKNPYIAFRVDEMQPYLDEAEQVIFGPVDNKDGSRTAFIVRHGALVVLRQED